MVGKFCFFFFIIIKIGNQSIQPLNFATKFVILNLYIHTPYFFAQRHQQTAASVNATRVQEKEKDELSSLKIHREHRKIWQTGHSFCIPIFPILLLYIYYKEVKHYLYVLHIMTRGTHSLRR